jgi:hypothetical protein
MNAGYSPSIRMRKRGTVSSALGGATRAFEVSGPATAGTAWREAARNFWCHPSYSILSVPARSVHEQSAARSSCAVDRWSSLTQNLAILNPIAARDDSGRLAPLAHFYRLNQALAYLLTTFHPGLCPFSTRNMGTCATTERQPIANLSSFGNCATNSTG